MENLKEYLRKNSNGTYSYIGTVRPEHVSDFMIEIPEGAIKAYLNNSKTINFVNSDDDYMNHVTKGEWVSTHRDMHEKCGHVLVWTRPTQPEELPFIDDEPQDNVNHPNHYANSSIECIDAMEAMLTPEQFIGYLRGNIFKYQWRYENKNGIEDIKKSKWYLEKLLEKLNEK